MMQIHLGKNQVWSMTTKGSHCRLSCGAGKVWVTQEGDSQDIVVNTNREFNLRSHSLIVVQALDEADITTEYETEKLSA